MFSILYYSAVYIVIMFIDIWRRGLNLKTTERNVTDGTFSINLIA